MFFDEIFQVCVVIGFESPSLGLPLEVFDVVGLSQGNRYILGEQLLRVLVFLLNAFIFNLQFLENVKVSVGK